MHIKKKIRILFSKHKFLLMEDKMKNRIMLQCPYVNPREMAYELNKWVQKEKKLNLTARPYNFRDPDNGRWWLIPSTETPAYKFGKYVFDFLSDETDILFCGFEVEKGPDKNDSDIRSFYQSEKGRRLLMSSDWTWFNFLNFLKSGRISNTISSIYKKVRIPLTFNISARILNDPKFFDPYDKRLPGDDMIFETKGDDLLFNYDDSVLEANLLLSLKNIKNLMDLHHTITKIKDYAWVWIDIWIGFPMVIAKYKAEGVSFRKYNINDIWNNILKPWLYLIR